MADGNALNPRIGSGLKQSRRLLEEKAVEGLRKPRGGTRRGTSQAFFQREPGNRGLGVDSSSVVRWRGIFGKPQERKLNPRESDGSTAER